MNADDGDKTAVAHFLRERSEAAFGVLYERHVSVMLAIATRLVRNRAEDAVQEAWIRAMAALPRFAWRSSLRTWLCGFVVNCCREISRREHDGPPIADNRFIDERASLLSATDAERAIAMMPPAAREVFVLHEIFGYTHDEIAEIAGIDAGTSKSQLHHARRTFRNYFEENDGRRTQST